MENLTYDQKITLLAMAKTPEERSALIKRFSTNTEFYLGFNAKTMPLEQYMELNKEEFSIVAKEAKQLRDNMRNHGWTDKKYQRLIAHLPEKLVQQRPEFNVYLPKAEATKNMHDFLAKYPQFRVNK